MADRGVEFYWVMSPPTICIVHADQIQRSMTFDLVSTPDVSRCAKLMGLALYHGTDIKPGLLYRRQILYISVVLIYQTAFFLDHISRRDQVE